MGPVISDRAAEYIQSLIDDAMAKGAQVLCGNQREGRYMQATVLDHVTEDMRIAWEEPFGPALPILRIKTLEEAIALSNKSQYGLQASIFTRDIDKAFHAGRKLDVGTVNINGPDSRGPGPVRHRRMSALCSRVQVRAASRASTVSCRSPAVRAPGEGTRSMAPMTR